MDKVLFRPGQQRVLEDLSDDVLTMIAEYVSTPKSGYQYRLHVPTSLLPVVLCSHRFQQIAEPILYREFVEFYGWSRPPPLRQQNFLCRLLARPDLAKRVRKYTGSGQSYNLNENDREEDEPYGLDMSAVTEEDWTRIRAAIQVLEPDGERTSLWNIEDGSWEAMTTLVSGVETLSRLPRLFLMIYSLSAPQMAEKSKLIPDVNGQTLSLLPNLEELEFNEWPPYGDELPSLKAFLSRSAKHQKEDRAELIHTLPPPLACLKSTSLIWRDDQSGMDLEYLFDFMKLKSLRSISGHSIASDPNWHGNDSWESRSERSESFKHPDYSHIINISLHRSAITDSRMAFLLRHCPNLQRFMYEHSGEVGPANFEAPKILLALLPVRSSLQELVIVDGYSEGILQGYPFGSFASFTALKSIETSQGLILGCVDSANLPSHYGQFAPFYPKTMTLITALPQTIEILILRWCNASLTPVLFELLAHTDHFPLLKYLEISWESLPFSEDYTKSHIHPGGSPSELVELTNKCRLAGIELKMIGGDPPDRTLFHAINPDSGLDGAGQPIYTPCRVKYPFLFWEEMCERYECDPATGKRFPGLMNFQA